MANVFISYAKEDRRFVDRLAQALGAGGHHVWFDRDLDVGTFRDQIVSELERAEAAIVVWSARSGQSRYVLDESERAARRGVLLPVRIDDTELPLGFGALQTLDLRSWSGRADDPRFKSVLDQINHIQKDATPPCVRPVVPFVRQSLVLALAIAATCAPVLAFLNAAKLGLSGSNALISSVAEAFGICAVCTVPVLLWCGFEARQFGLSHPGPILRRAIGIYAISAVVALAITAAATVAGVAARLSPAAALGQLGFVAVLMTLVLGALITIFKAGGCMIGKLRGS
jgi:hypothetical protein